MAIQKTPGSEYTGKVGKTVRYLLNGKMVERTIGINDGPPTAKQIRFRQSASLINDFLKAVKEFIRLGYSLESENKNKQFVNLAYSEIYQNALIGTYPKLKIDYAKVLLSKGCMPVVTVVNAKLIPTGIEYSWDATTNKVCKWSDIAMVLAYIPELEHRVEYLISGANRRQGREFLEFAALPAGTMVHTYISFISANHKIVSDSIYTGAFTWK